MSSSWKITDTITVGADHPLLLFCGPCQLESESHAIELALQIKKIASEFPVQLVFKASYDKANRTSINGVRGPGQDLGLQILQKVKEECGLPVVTDIHHPDQATSVAAVVDVLQIPAFLCRQTDLLTAAGATGLPVHLKKGQFMHPADMKYAAQKIEHAGDSTVLLCERGACFGYRDLVVDMRGILMMRNAGYPVVFDATHSVQVMGGEDGKSGGDRAYIAPLIRAAVACGVDGIFIETHEDPSRSPSDAASMLPLDRLSDTLDQACRIRNSLS